MNYLQLHNQIFNAIAELETKHAELLQYKDDPEALLDFPCDSKEAYTAQTGKEIGDQDYKTIVIINSLYNALYELDTALELLGYEVDC